MDSPEGLHRCETRGVEYSVNRTQLKVCIYVPTRRDGCNAHALQARAATCDSQAYRPAHWQNNRIRKNTWPYAENQLMNRVSHFAVGPYLLRHWVVAMDRKAYRPRSRNDRANRRAKSRVQPTTRTVVGPSRFRHPPAAEERNWELQAQSTLRCAWSCPRSGPGSRWSRKWNSLECLPS